MKKKGKKRENGDVSSDNRYQISQQKSKKYKKSKKSKKFKITKKKGNNNIKLKYFLLGQHFAHTQEYPPSTTMSVPVV